MGSWCTRMGQQETELKRLAMAHYRSVLEDEAHFSKAELGRLFNQYWAMAYKHNVQYSESRLPVLYYADLLKYTDARNPLHERIILAFMGSKPRDQMYLARLHFPSFVTRMSVFTRTARLQDKLEFLFRVYDTDNNEMINASDVKALLGEQHGDDMTEEQRDRMAHEFLKEFGSDEAVEVSKDMFVRNCGLGTALEDMVVRFS